MGNQASTLDSMVEKLFPPEQITTGQITAVNNNSPLKNGAVKNNAVNTKPKTGVYGGRSLGILSFEAAGVMHRALELWEVLRPERISYLRQSLQMEGILKLVSADKDFRWRLAGWEREKDLQKIMSSVALFGKRSSNVKLQQLKLRFAGLERPGADLSHGDVPLKSLEPLLGYMRHMVSVTNNLHSELEVLEGMQKNGNPLRISNLYSQLIDTTGNAGEKDKANYQNRMDGRTSAQTVVVQKLKAASLWIENADRAIQILVLFIYVIKKRLLEVFGRVNISPKELSGSCGSAGLALHYANLLISISKIVNRPTVIMQRTRVEIYHKVPRNIQRLLRARLRGNQKPFDPSVAADLRRTLEVMLLWILPVAQATLLWQREHSFGQQYIRRTSILQVQTLYSANKDVVEAAILELLVVLSYTVRPICSSYPPSQEEREKWTDWAVSGTGQMGSKNGNGRRFLSETASCPPPLAVAVPTSPRS